MRITIAFYSIIFFVGCGSQQKKAEKPVKPVFYAHSHLESSDGINGQVLFTEGFGKVTLKIKLEGLKPSHRYGIYFHEFGDCRNKNGTDAGSIYLKKVRGDRVQDPNKILGFVAPDGGSFAGEVEVTGFSLAGVNSPLIGRSIVVHSNPSDLTGEHSGRFEQRIGCGVIGAAHK